MKYIIGIVVILMIAGCSKEEMTLYYAYMKNSTSHKIEVKPYFGGINPTDKTIILLANEIKEIANGFDLGIVGNVGFNSSYFSGSDSIVVVFNNQYVITHYFNTPISTAPKFYLLSSNRNIYNKDNYDYTYNDLSKHKRESTYLYEFMEQDYLDTQ